MLEVALYLVAGLTLYAGGHHLYLGGNRASEYPHVQLGVLYLLLSGFALASAVTYQSVALDAMLPAGKVAVSFGLILWCLLVWHIAFRCDFKPWLLLDAITAGWLVFLVQNISSPNSLIYANVVPVKQTLLNGETLDIVHTLVSPWWRAVEIGMLVSLAFCTYAVYRHYRKKPSTEAYAIGTGLGLLALVALFDHFVSTRAISAAFIAPFGFLGFLAASSLYRVYESWQEMRKPKQPPMIYNLTFKPDYASFHTDVSQVRAPLGDDVDVGPSVEARRSPDEDRSFPVTEDEEIHDVQPHTLHAVPKPEDRKDQPAPAKPKKPQPPAIDETLLHTVTDNLIDIAVYATMALNRFKRGDADPRTLENLCKKIRTRAIKTRRVANRLAEPKQLDYDDGKREND